MFKKLKIVIPSILAVTYFSIASLTQAQTQEFGIYKNPKSNRVMAIAAPDLLGDPKNSPQMLDRVVTLSVGSATAVSSPQPTSTGGYSNVSGTPKAPQKEQGEIAAEFIDINVQDIFGIDPETLVATQRNEDQLGYTFISYMQVPNGLPVFGSDLKVVIYQGRVKFVNASVIPVNVASYEASISEDQAVETAQQYWYSVHGFEEVPETENSQLAIYAPGLVYNTPDATTRVVWQVKLRNEHDSKTYFVAANGEDAGSVLYTEEHTHHLDAPTPLDGRVYDCSPYGYVPGIPVNNCYSELAYSGYVFGRRKGSPDRGPNPRFLPGQVWTDTDTLYGYYPQLQSYYWEKFRRDGANGRGGSGNGTREPITRTAGNTYLDYVPNPYCLSGYCPDASNIEGNIKFWRGMVVPDVVGHEYAHGITYYSHYENNKPVGMTYQGEAGALDESHSDIMGELLEKYLTGSNDWLIGLNATSGIMRNIARPSAAPRPNYVTSLPGYIPPDHYQSSRLYCGTADFSGVHVNATAFSKALYMMAVGGTFNGCTIQSIGLDALEQILHRGVTLYYTKSASFAEAMLDLITASNNLYGNGSPTSKNVLRSLQATGMNIEGSCPPSNPKSLPSCIDPLGY